ncbi:PulJ/GspJ family protein [Hippea maritima]|uniref:Type IV pilus assembly protein PilW n=1 Tax=Hippea maritima (strain ATCC 700847 / DSM 10411 / MH2) TaxID=760142 RepID=F2LWB8_HIPMA|nr:prepilin-type N-terminal cleavage/methylation domain-containing protein [Hippea maritima]AEA34052.1 hypothetical protein Hipma_1086 [Hippea maritima DSM 10411]
MKKKGFTLIELMVAIFIFLLILTFIYATYTGILFNYKDIGKQLETQTQTVPALNILRLDIEHAGYGLASDEPNKPIEWDGTSLTIRSTINSTRNKTIGWELVKCDNSSFQVLSTEGSIDNNSKVVWIDAKNDNKFIANGTANTCPGNFDLLLGFPYEDNVSNGCSKQFCNQIVYSLSSDQNIPTCNKDTRNLLRKVGSSNGEPILNCVGGFDVIIDNVSKPTLVNVYILLQEGQKKRDYNFGNSVLSEDSISFDLSKITDYQHYRWKVIKISVKPMSEYRSYP